jgi:ABC-2 type transport system ATP-binding protein
MCDISIQEYTKIIKRKKVLDCIDLHVDSGTTVGIVGKNGSGKTMLLRAISGLIRPTTGKVIIDGRELTNRNPFPHSIGIVIEPASLWEQYTAYETLHILAGIRKKIGKESILIAMERLGLPANSCIPVGEFSLGMKKRLLIAQAIMEQPELLILDEPTNALDDEGITLFHKIIEEEHQKGTTIFIASHISEEINLLCPIVYSISDGKIESLAETSPSSTP